MSEDLSTRFIAYGWNVLRVGDANDVEVVWVAMKRRGRGRGLGGGWGVGVGRNGGAAK